MLHEMTADLVKKTNGYEVENLNVHGMPQNRARARSIAEQQWMTCVEMLTDKAARAGGWVQQAGRWKSPSMPGQYTRKQMARRGAVARLRYEQ